MIFFAPEKLSNNRKLTPDGFLVIEGTPIARTGVQMYAPEELGHKIEPEDDGMVHIHRRDEEVFKPESIASWNGKPLTNDHPSDMVNPLSWRQVAYGTILNPRRGTGDDKDLLVADIVVYDQGLMMLVDAGKVELSCGYNPEYAEFEPGKWEQRNIIGNHVALVAEGRCGPRCAIRDHKHEEHKPMPKRTYRDRLIKMFGVTDRAALDKALDEEMKEEGKDAEGEGGANETHIHLHNGTSNGATTGGAADVEEGDPMVAMGRRMDAFESTMKDIGAYFKDMKDKAAKDAEKEKEEEGKDADMEEEMDEEGGTKGAKDSASLQGAWMATVSMAEIIAPGLTPPTLDAKNAPKVTLEAICSYRRKALDLANGTPVGRQAIEELNGGKAFDAKCAACDKIRGVFRGAAAAMKRLNNGGSAVARPGPRDRGPGIHTVSQLAARAAQLYP